MRYREEAIECVKDHVLQIHKQIYAKYNGDFDRIYTEGYNNKSYKGRVIEPGKVYELSYLECTCPKVKCGLRNHPQQCECSRQSILYILSQLEPDSQFDVRIENTILRGSDSCTFRITRHADTKMETKRILLRQWRDNDAETLYKYASDPEVGPRAGWPPHKSVEESLEIIRTIFHSDHMWAIEFKETGEPIGCIGYMVHGESNIDIGENDAEVGYWVARPYWNRGICTEALRLLVDYCFREKGFGTLWADYFPDNPASGKVMEHCGFRDTGRVNRCSRLQLGSDRPVKIMRLDNNL